MNEPEPNLAERRAWGGCGTYLFQHRRKVQPRIKPLKLGGVEGQGRRLDRLRAFV